MYIYIYIYILLIYIYILTIYIYLYIYPHSFIYSFCGNPMSAISDRTYFTSQTTEHKATYSASHELKVTIGSRPDFQDTQPLLTIVSHRPCDFPVS